MNRKKFQSSILLGKEAGMGLQRAIKVFRLIARLLRLSMTINHFLCRKKFGL